MPYNFLLSFMHLKKWPLLPVFKYWPHNGENFHQLAWLEIQWPLTSFLEGIKLSGIVYAIF